MSLKQFPPNTTVPSYLALLFIAFFFTLPVHAEGSRELVNSAGNNGYRPFLEFNTSTLPNTSIPLKAIIKVFVNNGEWVYLGSSVFQSATDPQDIVYRSPSGVQK